MTGDNNRTTNKVEQSSIEPRTTFQKNRSSKLTIHRSTLKSGYSLAELLVVMLLFSFALLILGQTYIQFIRLSHKTANAAVVQQDTRFVLEYVARVVRGSEVYYSGSIASPTSSLRLLKEDGDYIEIKKSDPGDPLCVDEPVVSCLLVTRDSGITWAPLTANSVNVDTFNVFVSPTQSPFELSGFDYPNDQQPFVTINLTLTYNANSEREVYSQTAQTSISSRVYVR